MRAASVRGGLTGLDERPTLRARIVALGDPQRSPDGDWVAYAEGRACEEAVAYLAALRFTESAYLGLKS